MEHHHHSEEPKPSNKWLATPILLALVFILGVLSILWITTGNRGNLACKDDKHGDTHGTEQHDEHGKKDEHATTHDQTVVTNDSAKTDSSATHENHEGHSH